MVRNLEGASRVNESELSPNLTPTQKTLLFTPGTRVRITQQISQRAQVFTKALEGTVLRQERQSSGSWFARNKNDLLWLDRLILQKDDGEISIFNLDEFTRIEVLTGDTPKPGNAKAISPTTDRYAGIR